MSQPAGVLQQIEPPGPRLDFKINPEEMRRTGRSPRWEEQERPRRDSVMEWQGRTPYRYEFLLRLDNLDSEDAVDDDGLAQLRRWKGIFGPARRPRLLAFRYGNLLAAPVAVEDVEIEEGTEVRRASDLATIRADVRVVLVEIIDVDVDIPPVEARQIERPNPRLLAEQTITVTQADTLWQLATDLLGDGRRYLELMSLNDLDDPDLITPGQRLRVPRR